jgi:hypothetical protein
LPDVFFLFCGIPDVIKILITHRTTIPKIINAESRDGAKVTYSARSLSWELDSLRVKPPGTESLS